MVVRVLSHDLDGSRMTALLFANPDIRESAFELIFGLWICPFHIFQKLNSRLALTERVVESLMGFLVYYQSAKPDCSCQEARICADDSYIVQTMKPVSPECSWQPRFCYWFWYLSRRWWVSPLKLMTEGTRATAEQKQFCSLIPLILLAQTCSFVSWNANEPQSLLLKRTSSPD